MKTWPTPSARALALLLLTLGLAWPAPADPLDLAQVDPADFTHDRWYLDTTDGKPTGYWRSWLKVQDNRILTGYLIVAHERHGGEITTRRIRVQWTETLDYQPMSIRVEQEEASDKIVREYRFADDAVELTSEQNGRTTTQQFPPIEGDYLTAAQLTAVSSVYMARGRSFEANSIDPIVGIEPYKLKHTLAEEDPAAFDLADGTKAQAQQWTLTYSFLPGFEMQAMVDGKGRTVGMSYEAGGMKKVSRLADQSVTEVAFDPPEIAQRSVVVPDRAIQKPGKLRRIVYELSYQAGGDVLPAATRHQRVEELDAGRARVTVDLDRPRPAEQREQDKPTDTHLAATIKADHADEEVATLAQRAVAELGDDASAKQVALACKRLVKGHVNGATLSVGEATASEVARSREGDCTEHAVLLAALLRAHGIPSRCVTGLIYSEEPFAGQANAFIYHMWAQAWIADETDEAGGYWLDLDSAMWRYGAGHIALGVSDMGDNSQGDRVRLLPMMQGMQIKIIETK